MNLKAKAALDIVSFVLVAVAASAAVQFILMNVPLQTIGIGFGIGVFVWMIYLMYSIRLGQLESRERLKQMVDSK